ncbi:MAG: succinate dehydrogenase, hydrophobic membrane anchor protein [Gallionellaceae bacterium]|jgi:succinate dehydrogenase / fumarate reductase membrane anchor subunit
MLNRIVTGAHYGLRDWLIQRVTAVMMLLYTLVIFIYCLLQPVLDYNTWTLLFSSNVVRSFSLLFLLGVFYHAWIGLRDIVMDYVKPAFIRLLIYVLIILALLLYAIWSVQILWGM